MKVIVKKIASLGKSIATNDNLKLSLFDIYFMNEQVHDQQIVAYKAIRDYKEIVKFVENQRDVRVLLCAERRMKTMKKIMTEQVSFWKELRAIRNFHREKYQATFRKG